MDKTFQHPDEELLQYLDGKLSDSRVRELKSRLESHPGLQNRLQELRSVHQALVVNKLEHPSTNFTHRVMAGLYRRPVSLGLSPRNGLLLLCGVLVATGILTLLLSSGLFDGMNQSIALDALPIKQEVIKNPISSIRVSGKVVMNCVIFLNLALALVLLDRTVLRPYFNRRSRLHI